MLECFRGKPEYLPMKRCRGCLTAIKESKQKKNWKGAQAILKSRETLLIKLKNYGNFEKILIRCKCGVLNMIRHSKCSACKSELVAVAGQGRMVVIFLDLERCHGDLESTPTSVGLVARIGEVVVEKELFVMIDEGGRWELPRREDYIPKYLTGLYYEGSGADRRMMKRHVEDKNMKGKKIQTQLDITSKRWKSCLPNLFIDMTGNK